MIEVKVFSCYHFSLRPSRLCVAWWDFTKEILESLPRFPKVVHSFGTHQQVNFSLLQEVLTPELS